ncbi:Uncharacterized protein M6B38_231985 [Iris pallida]|uniref:Uncharacterized protein n=1 Tax=Iris pallida TaxID=29817 RepID=A0AAX6DRG0_IRIPA|nr:Uncharacterized protein M6B38_231985 [Iris pallida]
MNPVTAIVLFLSLPLRRPLLRGDLTPVPLRGPEVLQPPRRPPPEGRRRLRPRRRHRKFAVRFNSTCSFSLQGSYQIRYQPTVTGRISDGRLRDLKGVSVKILFVWVNIVEVDRNGDQLEFSVGIASADFPVENFDECPQCGCGWTAATLRRRRRRRRGGLS